MFGVGATKAGTTWLYEHLQSHPDCHLRAIKELHYFDMLESGRFGGQITATQRFAEKVAKRAEDRKGPGRQKSLSRMRDAADWMAVLERRAEDLDAYRAYLEHGKGEATLVADITPAYGLLSEQRLQQMAGLGGDVRFLYLLRDPVARLWSQIRMMASRAVGKLGDFAEQAYTVLAEVLAGKHPGAVARGDYMGAITRLNAAVDPRRLMVMFQEELLSVQGLERLSQWLGIRAMPGNFEARVLAGRELALPEGAKAELRALLAPQYDYVAAQFPDRLPASWQFNLGEDGK